MQNVKNEEYVICPRCGKEVYKGAIICPFCKFGIMAWLGGGIDENGNSLEDKPKKARILGGNNMVSKSWKIFQIIQFIVFLCVGVFLLTRAVDGHGTVQTLEAKLISFVIWLAFYLFVLAVEYGIRFITVIRKK